MNKQTQTLCQKIELLEARLDTIQEALKKILPEIHYRLIDLENEQKKIKK